MGGTDGTPQDLDDAPVKGLTDEDFQELREKMIENGKSCPSAWIQEAIRSHKDLCKNYRHIQTLVSVWAENWAITKQQYIDLLSRDQKQAIIHSLEGSCVQEDWEVLLSRLPGSVRESITSIFLETLILHKIHIQILEAPFWYLDGKLAPIKDGNDNSVPDKDDSNKSAPDDDGNDRDKTFPPRLQYLYARFLKTNPFRAALWKTETIRLANSVDKVQAPNTDFGHYNRKCRIAALPNMVKDLIASYPISLLLRNLSNKEEESARYNEMLRIFKHAADISTLHAAQRGREEFHRDLEKYETFTQGSDNMVAHHYHFPDKRDTRLDGRRVLLVVHPAVSIKLYNISVELPNVHTKAAVVVEDPEESVKDGAK
ncbi:hypothetical protein PHISCL_01242 [Aspergillus sclerotialis]|uniref:Uncharacterized protein n=1 Tax=Aspergillus sclerotialis TaxID=2070753 RepID=A0A3A3AAQ2_9EURO|nr:hypothetical protein PHISCL_01242 [Aspergillus sclerotialis]